VKIFVAYPGSRHATYDVALGYQEALIELGQEVTAFYLHDYLDYHAGALEHWRRVNPGCGMDAAQTMDCWYRLAGEHLVARVVDVQPDVVLIVCGLNLHRETYEILGKLPVPKVLLLTESPYIDGKQITLLRNGGFRLGFTNEKNSASILSEFGEVPVEYLPHSFSPKHHRPGPVGTEYQTDVFFHGTWFPERAKLFDTVADGLEGDFNLRIVGVGWEESIGSTQDTTPDDDLCQWYRGTKIALNHHRTTALIGSGRHIKSGAAWSLGPRAYEIAACGAFQLCDNTRPELGKIFGDSVPTYCGPSDLKRKIKYYLAHDDERMGLANESLNRVQHCSFVERARGILLPALSTIA